MLHCLGYLLPEVTFWRTNQRLIEKKELQRSYFLSWGAWSWRWNKRGYAVLCSCSSRVSFTFWLAIWGGSRSLLAVQDHAAFWSISIYNARSKSVVTTGIFSCLYNCYSILSIWLEEEKNTNKMNYSLYHLKDYIANALR